MADKKVSVVLDLVAKGSGLAAGMGQARGEISRTQGALDKLRETAAKQKAPAATDVAKAVAGNAGPQGSGVLGGVWKHMSGGKSGGAAAASVVQAVSGGGVAGLAKGALSAAGPWGMAASAVIDTLGKMTSTAMEFAAKASPVTAERLNRAMEDTQAVIGRSFVPVLELAADGVRLVGDALSSVLPETSEMREALAPVKDVFAELRQAAADIAPSLKQGAILALKVFSVVVKQTADAILAAVRMIRKAMNIASFGMIGSGEEGEKGLKSSVGAAGGQASFKSLSALGDDAIKSAYGAAGATKGSMEAVAENSERTNRLLEEIRDGLRGRTPGGDVIKDGRGAGSPEDWATVRRGLIGYAN